MNVCRIAQFQKPVPLSSHVQCTLCPHYCSIAPAQTGLCGSRRNADGQLCLTNYGQVAATHIDPIEKKPLYHFLPGSLILSFGNNGCNLRCPFCQNWSISQQTTPTQYLAPESLLNMAQRSGLPSVAFTYAEPMIWFEYILDCAQLLREIGIKTVLVSNGMINPDPLSALLPWIDAMNIDIKSMEPDFYRHFCHGYLEPVLETAKIASKTCHIEITNLVIPNRNDSDEMFHQLGAFISEHLSRQTPLHLSRYHPDYHLSEPVTPCKTLKRAQRITAEYLDFIYLGNISNEPGHSVCPGCGTIVVSRNPDGPVIVRLTPDHRCPVCHRALKFC